MYANSAIEQTSFDLKVRGQVNTCIVAHINGIIICCNKNHLRQVGWRGVYGSLMIVDLLSVPFGTTSNLRKVCRLSENYFVSALLRIQLEIRWSFLEIYCKFFAGVLAPLCYPWLPPVSWYLVRGACAQA